MLLPWSGPRILRAWPPWHNRLSRQFRLPFRLSAPSSPWRQVAADQIISFSLVKLFWIVPSARLNSSPRQGGSPGPRPGLECQELDLKNWAGHGRGEGPRLPGEAQERLGIRRQSGWEERYKVDRRSTSRRREHLKLKGWRRDRAWNSPMQKIRLGTEADPGFMGPEAGASKQSSSTNKCKLWI